MLKTIVTSASIAAAALVSMSAEAQNLVTNGGFETTSTSSGNGNFEINRSGTSDNFGTVNGWFSVPAPSTQAYNLLFHSTNANSAAGNALGQYSSTGREYLDASTASPNGGNFVALDGDSNVRGYFYTVLNNLTVGNTYTLSFYWGGGQLNSSGIQGSTLLTEQLQYGFATTSAVAIPGSQFATNTLTYAQGTFTGWNQVTQNFTAANSSQILSFLSIGSPNGLPPVALLDGVSVTAAVPEPSTWMMMILGFGAVGFAARRARVRKVSFA